MSLLKLKKKRVESPNKDNLQEKLCFYSIEMNLSGILKLVKTFLDFNKVRVF